MMKQFFISLFAIIFIAIISLFCYQYGEKKGYQKGFDVGYSYQCRTTTQDNPLDDENHFTDKRDGQRYKKVKIGDQIWMAENLSFKTDKSVCFKHTESNCKPYGRFYPWNEAMISCPAGWHLPNDNEVNQLIAFLGDMAGQKLKSASTWNGIDFVGFNGLSAGNFLPADYIGKQEDAFTGFGDDASFWSATQNDDLRANGWSLKHDRTSVVKFWANKVTGHTVRCIKD